MDAHAHTQKKRKLPPLITNLQHPKKRKTATLDTSKASQPDPVPSIPTGRSLDSLLPSILEHRVRSKDIRQDPMGFISTRPMSTRRRSVDREEVMHTAPQQKTIFPKKGAYYNHLNDGSGWRGRRRYIMKFRIIEWDHPATDARVEDGIVSPKTRRGLEKLQKPPARWWELIVVVD